MGSDLSVSDQFEQLIGRGEIKFAPAKKEDLSNFGHLIVAVYIEKAGLTWELGDVKIGASYCLKIHDDLIHYLDVLEEAEQFVFCIDNHHSSVKPDEASAYLIAKTMPGIKIRVEETDSIRLIHVELPNGEKFTISDFNVLNTRILQFKRAK